MSWNRQTVREFNRKHKTNYTKAELEALEFAMKFRAGNLEVQSMQDLALNPFIRLDPPEPIPEGTEVKLNYDIIVKRPTKMLPKYLDFLAAHKDEVLHTTNENAKEGYVCLAEDPDKIWMFSPMFDLLYLNGAGEFVEYGESVLMPKEEVEEISKKDEENA